MNKVGIAGLVLMTLLSPIRVWADASSSARIAQLSDQAADLAQAQRAQGVALASTIWDLAELGYLEMA